ncbi:MAG: hypothetical protein ACRDDY_13725 [Clostridium sp.]|uniref:hypothetical protein n=1 Tax=Clostridium sp. TaxID=1506 RepID=UPI003EE49A26
MMRDALKLLHERLPKMNDVICEGIAYNQSKSGGIERTVNSYLRGAFTRTGEYDGEGLPDKFKYLRLQRITPLEEHKLRTDRIKTVFSRKAGLDISKTSTYIVKAIFENNGDTFERPIAIPFLDRGNMIQIRDSQYSVSNVMKSRGISRTPNGFFVEFPRHKVTFESMTGEYEINGKIEHVLIPTATNLHSKTSKRSFKPVIVGWLLAKYGVTEVFKRFADCDISIYASDDPALADIDHEKFAVCRAIPKNARSSCRIALVVPHSALTLETKVLLGGTLYIASYEQDQMYVEEADKLERWQIMLGYMIYGRSNTRTLAHILEEMQTHLTSIERFMDEKFRSELYSVDIDADDIYEFLYFIIVSMTRKTSTETRDIANLSGRYISPIEYILRDLREAIFDTMYTLVRQARKDRGYPIPTRQVKQLIDRGIGIDVVTKMNTGHGEVSSYMTASDNLYLSATANCIDQTEAKKQPGRSGGTVSLTDPTKQLHSTFMIIGCVNWLPKSGPYGTTRISPYCPIDADGRVYVAKEMIEDANKVQTDLDAKGF